MNLNSPFSAKNVDTFSLEEDVEIVFVSDMFVDDYVGGAELTTEALIEKCPVKYQKVHSKRVSVDLLEMGHGKHWIFGNFSSMDLELIPTIVANTSYSVL